MLIGFVGAMALPLCLMYLARAFFMQRRFQRTQAIENNAIDAVHLEASKSQGGTALGAGETPEDAIPVSWAKSFLDQHPERASLVFAACDRRLRTQTLYFPYLLYLSGILYIVTNVLDMEPRGGWLGVAAFFGVIAGVSVAVIIWAESGYHDFWKLFRTTIFKSMAVWRFGLTGALGLLLIGGSIPAYFYGIKTHPNLVYNSYDKFNDVGVTFEYPREWRRKPYILEISKSDVTINICPDHTLPKSDDALYTQLMADMKKRETIDHTVSSWNVKPLTLANGYGFLADDLNQSLRTLSAYVRDTDKVCWLMLRMSGNDVNASHEQAFMKILHNLQFVHKPQQSKA